MTMIFDRVRQGPKAGDVWMKRGTRSEVTIVKVVARSVFVKDDPESDVEREMSLHGFLRWYVKQGESNKVAGVAGRLPKRGI